MPPRRGAARPPAGRATSDIQQHPPTPHARSLLSSIYRLLRAIALPMFHRFITIIIRIDRFS
jgi:hypothetical protein